MPSQCAVLAKNAPFAAVSYIRISYTVIGVKLSEGGVHDTRTFRLEYAVVMATGWSGSDVALNVSMVE